MLQTIAEKWNRSRPFLYFNVVVLFILLNAIGSKASLRMDLSRDRINSLSGSTKLVLSRMENPILVEAYISQDVPGEILSMLQPILSQLEEFRRVGGDRVELHIINPNSKALMDQAESRGIQGIPVEQADVNEISQRMGYFGIYMQMGDKSSVVDLVDNGQIVEDLEYRMLREIKKMMRKGDRSGIGILDAPGTLHWSRWRSIQDQNKDNIYGYRALLEREMGTIDDVDLKKPLSRDLDLLLVTGMPDLDQEQVYHLDQFLMQGGNIIFMLRGFDFDMTPVDPTYARLGLGGPGGGYATVPRDALKKMNDWLGKYGVGVNGEVLFEPELGVAARDVQGQYVVPVPNPAWSLYSRDSQTVEGDIPAIRYTNQVVLPWYSGLDVREALQPDVKFSVILKSTPGAIRRSTSSLDLKAMQQVGRLPGDERLGHSEPLALFARGRFRSAFSAGTVPAGEDKSLFRDTAPQNAISRIAVIGTPYLVSDMFLQNETNLQIFTVNRAFLTNLMEATIGDTDLLAARARVHTISHLSSPGRSFETAFMWFHILFLPLALGIYGAFRLFRRNQRRGLADRTDSGDGEVV